MFTTAYSAESNWNESYWKNERFNQLLKQARSELDTAKRRESLVDMRTDPLETKNLAGQPEHRNVLLQHRRLLQNFAATHDDALVERLLADDVAGRPFPVE